VKRSFDSFPLVGVALDSRVKPRKSRVADLRSAKAKIKRVVERATESMVKVTGKVKDSAHLKGHMDYISRNGKIELENERGEIIETHERLREEHKQWSEELGKPRANERHTVNIVLSMPAGTHHEAVRRAARDFAKEEFGDTNQYLMALHHPGNDEGTKQPHVHLTVKARGYDGARLNPKKADLQEWRELFAKKMREQGYDVEATPRRSRGVVEKGTKHIVQKITEAGRSYVYKAKIKEASDAIERKEVSKNPYVEVIKQKQIDVRKGWLKAADELDVSSDPDDRRLAAKVRQFVAQMPKELKDERLRLKDQVLSEVVSKRKHEADRTAAAEAKGREISR
jgi:hypothetical protein